MNLNFLKIIGDLFNSFFGLKPPTNVPVANPPAPPEPVVPPDPVAPEPPAPEPTAPVLNTVTGSSFIQANINLTGSQREANILREFLNGNIPDFLRNFVSVAVSDGTNSITYLAMSDFLAIGTDDDYVRMPMNPHTAQSIADRYGCTLVTKKMAYDIWRGAINKLAPRPWGPPYDSDMEKTYRIGVHNATIQKQLVSGGMDPHALTSGHKKDIVLTNFLGASNINRKVAIYGWIQLNGQPIQGLNYFSHSDTYADYSHGVRLVSNDCVVNGVAMKMQDVFSHPVYCRLVSDEGPLKFLRY